MSNNSYNKLVEDIPANKDERKNNQNAEDGGKREGNGSLSAVPLNQKEATKLKRNQRLESIKAKSENDAQEISGAQKEQQHREILDDLKGAIDTFIEDDKNVLLSKQISLGSGLMKPNQVLFSPDFKFFALGSSDKRGLRMYSTESERLLWFSEAFEDEIFYLQFSTIGNYLIAASRDNTLRTFGIKDGQLLKTWPLKVKVNKMCMNGSETLIVADNPAQKIIFLEWPSGIILNTLDLGGNMVNQFVFNSKNSMVAIATDVWYILNPNNQEVIFKSPENYQAWGITTVCFSNDDKYLASGCQDGSIKVFDLQKKNPTEFTASHLELVIQVKFGLDQRTLISSGHDGSVKLWDITKVDQPIKEFSTTNISKAGKSPWGWSGVHWETIEHDEVKDGPIINIKQVKSFDINPQRTKLVACSDSEVALFDVTSGKLLIKYESKFNFSIQKSFYSHEEDKILFLSSWTKTNGSVTLTLNDLNAFDIKTYEKMESPIKIVAKDKEGNLLKEESGAEMKFMITDILLATDESSRYFVSYTRSDDKVGVACSIRNENEWVVEFENPCYFWKTNEGSKFIMREYTWLFYEINGYEGNIIRKYDCREAGIGVGECGVYSRDQSFIIFSGSSYDIFFIETRYHEQLKDKIIVFETRTSGKVIKLEKSRDEKLIACVYDSGTVFLCDIQTKKQIHEFDLSIEERSAVRVAAGSSVAFTIDGKSIIIGGEALMIYDLESKLRLLSIPYLNENKITNMELSPTGDKLFVTSRNNFIEVYKTDSGDKADVCVEFSRSVIKKVVFNKAEDKYMMICSSKGYNQYDEFRVYDFNTNKIIEGATKRFQESDIDFVIDQKEQNILFFKTSSVTNLWLCKLINFQSIKEMKFLKNRNESSISSAIFSAYGEKIIIALKSDCKIKTIDFNLETLKESSSDDNHSRDIQQIIPHPKKREIFSSAEIIKVWNEDNLALLRNLEPDHEGSSIVSIALSPDGNLLYSFGSGGNFRVSDIRKTEIEVVRKIDFYDHGGGGWISLNGKGDKMMSIDMDGLEFKVWDTADFKILHSFKGKNISQGSFYKIIQTF